MELLAPAGDIEIGKANINFSDAIYLGGKSFSARSSANNFTIEEIEEIVQYAHLRGVKVYVTINTLYKNKELFELVTFMDKLYQIGVSAFIIQDIGLLPLIKKRYPKIQIHGSTQLSVHSLKGVQYMEKLGFHRIVLSRESSLEEIKLIKKESNIELELFVHGALCVSYSGQCLMSSLIGGRSGNRGKCAGSCRKQYCLQKNGKTIEDGYLLSPKDIMTIDYIQQFKEIGISSLKIEGRLKNLEYGHVVSKSYREAIDGIKPNLKTKEELTQVFNRGGSHSTGYLNVHSSEEMMSTKTPKSTGLFIGKVVNYQNGKCKIKLDKEVVKGDGIEIWSTPHTGTNVNVDESSHLIVKIEGNIKKGDLVFKSYDKRLHDKYKSVKDTKQVTITGEIYCQKNKPLKLVLNYNGITVTQLGDIIETATNKGTTKNTVVEKMGQTGNTPFKIDFKKVLVDDDLYVNIKNIKTVKRDAIEQLQIQLLKSLKREVVSESFNISKNTFTENKQLTVFLKDVNKLKTVCNMEEVSKVYIPIEKLTKETILFEKVYVSLGTICDSYCEKELIQKIKDLNIQKFLVSTYGQLQLLKNNNVPKENIVLSYNFNIFNTLSKNYLLEQSNKVFLSPELNISELEDLSTKDTEIIIHGHLPVMETKQCPIGLYMGKKSDTKYCTEKGKSNSYVLKDSFESFEIEPHCNFCYASILNSHSIFMLDKLNDLKNISSSFCIITDDLQTINAYAKTIFTGEESFVNKDNITRGHFYRGVL